MSADLLRRAAAKIRERAGAPDVAPAPWRAAEKDGNEHLGARGYWCVIAGDFDWAVSPDAVTQQEAEHIASWHPDVALAVADLLDHRAAKYEADVARMQKHYGPEHGEKFVAAINDHIIAVARAYLGES